MVEGRRDFTAMMTLPSVLSDLSQVADSAAIPHMMKRIARSTSK